MRRLAFGWFMGRCPKCRTTHENDCIALGCCLACRRYGGAGGMIYVPGAD